MRNVILDCDPGHDDALAILLAAGHLNVLGITTVAGNQTIDNVTSNALKILTVAGLTHIPVARGMAGPLVPTSRQKPDVHGPDFHGETGLDGPDLPEPTISPDRRHAVDFIIETIRSHDEVTLVPTGPLTNIALALRREPSIVGGIREISLMGGGLTHGNVSAAAEFNILMDPEAAHIVFTCGAPVKMCGINLTRQVMATPVEADRMRAIGNRTGQVVAELLDFFLGTCEKLFGLPGGPLHDPCAVVPLIDTTLIEFEPMRVDIELYGEHTYGMTLCDHRHLLLGDGEIKRIGKRMGDPPYTEVGLRIDRERFFDLLTNTLAAYP